MLSWVPPLLLQFARVEGALSGASSVTPMEYLRTVSPLFRRLTDRERMK
jgi:hypothetical protein